MNSAFRKVGVLAIAALGAALVGTTSAIAQQKPSLKQLEQQAKERLEADRRRRQELETQALERQRLEAAEAIARQQREAAAAAEAAEAENQRLLIQSAKDKAREERTPVVKGDSLVCPSGEYRSEAASLVDIDRPYIDGGVLGSYDMIRTPRGPPFGWFFLPDYWTKPPVRAFVLRNADSTRRVKEPDIDFSYSLSTDPSLVVAEPELKALAEMVSEKFFSLGNDFRQSFSLIGRSGDDHDLFVSMEQIALTTKGKVSAIWNRDTDGDQLHLVRPLYLCIDGMLQERILIDLFATTEDQFGAREKTSPYSVLIVTDIPFTEVTAASDQSAFSTVTITVDAIENAISDLRMVDTEGFRMVDTEGSRRVRKIMLPKGRYRLRPVTSESSGRDSAVVFCRCDFDVGAPPYYWIYDYTTSEKGRSRVGVTLPYNRQFSAAEAFSKAQIESFELKSDGWIKLFIYDDEFIHDNAGAVSVAIERLSPN